MHTPCQPLASSRLWIAALLILSLGGACHRDFVGPAEPAPGEPTRASATSGPSPSAPSTPEPTPAPPRRIAAPVDGTLRLSLASTLDALTTHAHEPALVPRELRAHGDGAGRILIGLLSTRHLLLEAIAADGARETWAPIELDPEATGARLCGLWPAGEGVEALALVSRGLAGLRPALIQAPQEGAASVARLSWPAPLEVADATRCRAWPVDGGWLLATAGRGDHRPQLVRVWRDPDREPLTAALGPGLVVGATPAWRLIALDELAHHALAVAGAAREDGQARLGLWALSTARGLEVGAPLTLTAPAARVAAGALVLGEAGEPGALLSGARDEEAGLMTQWRPLVREGLALRLGEEGAPPARRASRAWRGRVEGVRAGPRSLLLYGVRAGDGQLFAVEPVVGADEALAVVEGALEAALVPWDDAGSAALISLEGRSAGWLQPLEATLQVRWLLAPE